MSLYVDPPTMLRIARCLSVLSTSFATNIAAAVWYRTAKFLEYSETFRLCCEWPYSL